MLCSSRSVLRIAAWWSVCCTGCTTRAGDMFFVYSQTLPRAVQRYCRCLEQRLIKQRMQSKQLRHCVVYCLDALSYIFNGNCAPENICSNNLLLLLVVSELVPACAHSARSLCTSWESTCSSSHLSCRGRVESASRHSAHLEWGRRTLGGWRNLLCGVGVSVSQASLCMLLFHSEMGCECNNDVQ